MLFTLIAIGCIENGLYPIVDANNEFEESTEWTPFPQNTHSEDDTGIWGPYDVLVVLDTSGSMRDDTLIHFGISQIPYELNSHASSWQLRLITADAEETALWEVLPTNTDPEWAVMEGISYLLSTNAIREEGIDAALAYQADNSSWFRPGVTTLLVLVSDEDDQSEVDPSTLLSTWTNPLQIVTVVGLEEADRNPDKDPNYMCGADAGTRYLQIATRSVDICTTTRWSVF